jgi:hypothetical protein
VRVHHVVRHGGRSEPEDEAAAGGSLWRVWQVARGSCTLPRNGSMVLPLY